MSANFFHGIDPGAHGALAPEVKKSAAQKGGVQAETGDAGTFRDG